MSVYNSIPKNYFIFKRKKCPVEFFCKNAIFALPATLHRLNDSVSLIKSWYCCNLYVSKREASINAGRVETFYGKNEIVIIISGLELYSINY